MYNLKIVQIKVLTLHRLTKAANFQTKLNKPLIKVKKMKVNEIMTALEAKHPGENEYLQAVREVLETIEAPNSRLLRLSSALLSPIVSSSSASFGLTIKVRPRSTSATVCSTTLPSVLTKAVSASTPK